MDRRLRIVVLCCRMNLGDNLLKASRILQVGLAYSFFMSDGLGRRLCGFCGYLGEFEGV